MFSNSWLYPVFVIWVSVIALLAVFVPFRQTRGEQFWMSVGGAIGGLCIAYLYQDFFRPPSSHWWHAGFGGAYLGIVAAVSLKMVGKKLVPERSPSVDWRGKASVLAIMTMIAGLLFFFGVNSVMATAVAFAAGAYGIARRREDLQSLVRMGAIIALLYYVTLLGIFLLILPDIGAAGRALSPYYAEHGFWRTFGNLVIWTPAFGAFFASGHAFLRNKGLVLYR